MGFQHCCSKSFGFSENVSLFFDKILILCDPKVSKIFDFVSIFAQKRGVEKGLRFRRTTRYWLIKNSLNSESVISKGFDSVNWESNSALQAKMLCF